MIKFILHSQHNQYLVAVEPAQRQCCTAATQQYGSYPNDNGRIVSPGLVGNGGRQLIVHDDYSSVEMMRWIISGSLSVGAPVQPPDDKGGENDHECTDEDGQDDCKNG